MTDEHKITEPSFLLSVKGVKDQRPHYDFNKFNCDDIRRIPFSCIVSLDPFKLKVWPGVFKDMTTHTTHVYVDVSPGEMIVFRGDLKHAGGPGEGDRIHFFCDNPSLVNGEHPTRYTVLA